MKKVSAHLPCMGQIEKCINCICVLRDVRDDDEMCEIVHIDTVIREVTNDSIVGMQMLVQYNCQW